MDSLHQDATLQLLADPRPRIKEAVAATKTGKKYSRLSSNLRQEPQRHKTVSSISRGTAHEDGFPCREKGEKSSCFYTLRSRRSSYRSGGYARKGRHAAGVMCGDSGEKGYKILATPPPEFSRQGKSSNFLTQYTEKNTLLSFTTLHANPLVCFLRLP